MAHELLAWKLLYKRHRFQGTRWEWQRFSVARIGSSIAAMVLHLISSHNQLHFVQMDVRTLCLMRLLLQASEFRGDEDESGLPGWAWMESTHWFLRDIGRDPYMQSGSATARCSKSTRRNQPMPVQMQRRKLIFEQFWQPDDPQGIRWVLLWS